VQAERNKIELMLNFDMVGSPNFVRFVYDGDNSAFPVGPGVQAGPPAGLGRDRARLHALLRLAGARERAEEDPGSHNQYAPGAGPNARVWRYDLASGGFASVAIVDQSADPAARAGAWESSGIVDTSAAFGPGSFLTNVQAHTIFIETAPGPDLVPPAGPDWLYKREGGQLLVLHIPGA
jgi:hypothetical protein